MVDKTVEKTDDPVDSTEDPGDGTLTDYISGWGDLSIPDALQDLQDYSDRLIAIAKNPTSFVLGALVAALLGFVLDIAKVFYDGLSLILIGDGLGYVEGSMIGIEDLFYISWDIISGAGEAVGSPILGVITDLQNSALSLAEGAGIASFPLSVLLIVATIVGFYLILSNLGRATLAAIPVIGPFLEVILFE